MRPQTKINTVLCRDKPVEDIGLCYETAVLIRLQAYLTDQHENNDLLRIIYGAIGSVVYFNRTGTVLEYRPTHLQPAITTYKCNLQVQPTNTYRQLCGRDI